MRIGILTSGGDAPGMNAAIRSVVRAARYYNFEIYGIYDGYNGLVQGHIVPFEHHMVSEILSKGGTILRTARLDDFKQVATQKKAIEQLKNYDIEALIVIGGDGTYRGAADLQRLGIRCIGIPGTIDNDIDSTQFTIGFATAVETIVDAIDRLKDTSSSHQRCSVVETMGRTCGDLALYAGLCGGAEYIITPESGFDKQKCLDYLKDTREKGRRHALVVITENMTDVHLFAKEIEAYSGYETRATILGYTQRGGKPCPEDRILASRMGAYAVELLTKDIDGCSVGIKNNTMIHTPFNARVNHGISHKELQDLVNKIS